jgi:MFS transporter, PPP family, 3-phenylpropionic acid transporter
LKSRTSLLTPKLLYFTWYLTLGSFAPFVTIYYRERGLDLSQIGLLLALSGMSQIVAGPLWGLLADTLRLHRILLPLAILGTVVSGAFLGTTNDFVLILALAACSSVFSVPVGPLSDSATLQLLGERRDLYGAQRMWGAVGWGVSTVLAGLIIERLGLPVIFYIYPLLGLVAILVALRLPQATYVPTDVRAAARAALRDPRWIRLLVCTVLIGCAGAQMHGFLSIYMTELGAGKDQIGLAYTIASVSELPVMMIAVVVLRRWGARPLFVCAGVAYALRLSIYAIFPDPTVALLAQLLHGLCFATVWVAGVHEAQRLAPPGLDATAQSLFNTSIFGVAVILANSIGGVVYQSFGYPVLFGVAALLALAGGLGYLMPVGEDQAATQHIAAG